MVTINKEQERYLKLPHGWGEYEVPYHLSKHPPTPKWTEEEIEKYKKWKKEWEKKNWYSQSTEEDLMSIIARDNFDSENFEKTPLGLQQAICTFIEDIGTQEGSYKGKPTLTHQIVIVWELAEKMRKGDNIGKPFGMIKFYTLSLSEKANLRKDLESWRGRAFTPEELKGFEVENIKLANCYLNIIEKEKLDGKIWAQIASISPLLKGVQPISKINASAPEWIQKMRERSVEWNEQSEKHDIISTPSQGEDDDLPF